MDENDVLDTQLLSYYLREYYHDRKPIDFMNARVKEATRMGDNYGSTIHRVEFQVMTANGRKVRKSVIVKTIARWTIGLRYEESYASPVFRWETMIYTAILPLMENLMDEYGDRRDTLWPSLIGYRPYNLIAVEDLTETRFRSPVRSKCMNLTQSILVLRSLGRFHAMTKMLMAKQLISNHESGRLLFAMDNDFIKKLWYAYFTMTSRGMQHWGETWAGIAEKLLNLRDEVTDRWTELAKNYDPRFAVLNHGDLWMCNIMIQNTEYDGIPVAVKFVDFQGAHINSFIWDIVYFLFSSTITRIRRHNMDILLNAYHASLVMNLTFFNYQGYIPTMEDVMSEFQRVEFVSLSCLLFHPLFLSDKLLDMAKIPTEPPEEALNISVYADPKARDAIGEDLRYFDQKGVLKSKKIEITVPQSMDVEGDSEGDEQHSASTSEDQSDHPQFNGQQVTDRNAAAEATGQQADPNTTDQKTVPDQQVQDPQSDAKAKPSQVDPKGEDPQGDPKTDQKAKDKKSDSKSNDQKTDPDDKDQNPDPEALIKYLTDKP